MRQTKLVITMGPALMKDERLRAALAQADVVRLNASHSNAEERTSVLQLIRTVARDLDREIAVLLDLQGPKWRIGVIDADLELAVGSVGVFFPAGTVAPSGYPWAAPLPHPELFDGARSGQVWSLDDGALQVRVVEAESGLIRARVEVGGVLKSRKGVHPIGLDVAFDPLTPKDLEDIRWGIAQDVDLFAQSFVRSASDLRALESRIAALGGCQPIIAKIEHPRALDNLDEILEVAWGVMVARGDLGVELGLERVPTLQKHIIRRARLALKPVITATQMLESMIEHPQPTRAEASDVANAIWDGTDALMLSAESAAGQYPLEAISWLARIAEDADAHYRPHLGSRLADSLDQGHPIRTDLSVALAACQTADEVAAKYLVVFTEGGGSARMVSRLAANIPVIGATTSSGHIRRMGLLRGVHGLLIQRAAHMSEVEAAVYPEIRTRFNLTPGDRIVVTFGHPLWTIGTTNSMKVVTI